MPVASAFLPRQIVWFGFGLIALWIGLVALVALDTHTTPGTIGGGLGSLGGVLIMVWAILAFTMLFVRWASDLRRHCCIQPFHPWLGWAPPIGALMAVFALHWLSNRLAGTQPAWLIHWLVGGGAALFALLCWAIPQRLVAMPSLRPLMICISAGIALLVAKAARDVPGYATLAIRSASGDPFCLLTFAGRRHPREVAEIMELSPLVSRRGGRSAADDGGWIVVLRKEGIYPEYYRSDPPCTPVRGGNLDHL